MFIIYSWLTDQLAGKTTLTTKIWCNNVLNLMLLCWNMPYYTQPSKILEFLHGSRKSHIVDKFD